MNVFACLVHEALDCVADLVDNLQFLDPDSTILLYDGSGGRLLPALAEQARPGVVVHPRPRSMAWGRLHDFALDCMRFALDRLSVDALTIVDSDQLAIRPGYSEFLGAFLARHPDTGCLVSAEGVQPRTTRIGPPQAAWREFELWQPFLRRFPEGESNFPHWTFWPGTVFTRAAAESLLALWPDDQLQEILAKSAIWASEEVLLPSLVALGGRRVLRNPCSYDLIQFRASYSIAQLDAAMARPSVFWVHPVPRIWRDPVRSHVRARFNRYLPGPPAPATDPFKDGLPGPLPLLLPLLRQVEPIEGWLSLAEADLLAAAAVQALARSPAPQALVEVGSYCGRATVLLGAIARALRPGSTVHAIDPHDGKLGEWGQPPCGVPDAGARLQRHLDAASLGDVVRHHRCPSSEAVVAGPIGLLLIDHLHDYASVAADFSQFHAQLPTGGLVAFHDYGDSFRGVGAFVDQLLAGGSYAPVQRIESLVVVRKVDDLPLPAFGPALAQAGSVKEREALALLAMTAAEALRAHPGGIVDTGCPSPAERQLLAAAAAAGGRPAAEGPGSAAGQPPACLLVVGGADAGEGGHAAAQLRSHGGRVPAGGFVAVRGCSDETPDGLALVRALLSGGSFEQLNRRGDLMVLRVSASASRAGVAAGPAPVGVGPPPAGVGPVLAGVGPALAGVGPALAGVGPALAGGRRQASARGAQQPLVSCVMPTCDRRRFVGRAIRYFLEQDYPNRELVIVDDGADRVEDLVPDGARVRYLRLPARRSIGAKRNLGCEQARGELVVHWDDDDWSAPWRLRYQVEMFQRQDVDVSGLSAVYFCDPKTARAWRYEYPAGRRPWVTDASFCYRHRFWETAPFPDTSHGIDTTYLWQGSPKRIGTLPECSFYVGLVHTGNTSRKDVHDAWWHPRPVEEIAALMGSGWEEWQTDPEAHDG